MEGKKYLLLFLIFLLPSSVYSLCEGTSFSDSFDYSGTFASQGYTYTSSCGFACEKNIPITSPFTTNAFGYNSTNGACSTCGFDYYRNIKKSLSINFTSGSVFISMNLAILNITNPLQTSFLVQVGNTTGSQKFSAYINTFGVLNSSLIHVDITDSTGQDCVEGKNISSTFSVPLLISIDLSSRTYSINFNGTSYCEGYSLGNNDAFYVGAISLSEGIDANKNMSVYLDDVQVCSDSLTNVSGELGTPCTTGGDCQTGRCDYGMCVQKSGNEVCLRNSDCISNRCIGNKCSKPSLSKLLTASVSELFGTDSESLTLVSLFLMIGIPTAVVISASALGSSVLALFAVVLFIILGFMFTLIGWLNPFITLGIVVCGLVITIFVFMLKANS